MQIWRNCWNCAHETPQERIEIRFSSRIVEMFSKKATGKVEQKVWACFSGYYQFCECTKCKMPILHVDEYWPNDKNEAEARENLTRIYNAFQKTGQFESEQLVHRLSYPSFTKDPVPEWTKDLEPICMSLFWEVYKALSSNLNTLAMMGIRTLIDIYANNKVGDIGGFDKKVKKLLDDKFISNEQHSLLQIVIEAGHASSHRGYQPAKTDVESCLKIIESLFMLTSFGDELKEIKSKIPSRANP